MTIARIVSLATVAALVLVGAVFALLRTPGPEATASFITDDEGRSLIQHGFSMAGSAKSSESGLPDFTEADLDQEHEDMGTNFVRFLISWRAVEPEPGQYDQEYLDGLEEMVSWYGDRGYHVMLDMHQDLWGADIIPGKGLGNGAPGWATETDGFPIGEHDQWELYYLEPGVIRAFDNFWNSTGNDHGLTASYAQAWRAVAERFAGNPTVVAYDLMNEPYGGSMQGPIFEAGPLTALYQNSIDAIREVDSDTWACLEPQALGFNWGLPTGIGQVNDPREGDARVAFCPHLYPLPMDLGEGFSGASRGMVEATVAGWRGNTLRTAQALGDVPVILGEFGLDTTLAGALDYVDLVYQSSDEIGMGVAYWSRDNGSWGPYEDDGTPRNLVAQLNRPYLRAAAGMPGEISVGAQELSFTLLPDASVSAPSEIYLPAGTFADGGVVQGADIVSWDAATRILQLRVDGDQKQRVVITPR